MAEGGIHVIALDGNQCHCQLQVIFKIFLGQIN